jgi:hypothetical protein
MTRFWIRNLTSRNDSRTGPVVTSRGGVGGAPGGAGTLGGAAGVPGAAGGAPVGRFRFASAGTSPTPF